MLVNIGILLCFKGVLSLDGSEDPELVLEASGETRVWSGSDEPGLSFEGPDEPSVFREYKGLNLPGLYGFDVVVWCLVVVVEMVVIGFNVVVWCWVVVELVLVVFGGRGGVELCPPSIPVCFPLGPAVSHGNPLGAPLLPTPPLSS